MRRREGGMSTLAHRHCTSYTPLSRDMFRIAHMAIPAPTVALLDAVVAMRSESRAGPRAIATVIFH